MGVVLVTGFNHDCICALRVTLGRPRSMLVHFARTLCSLCSAWLGVFHPSSAVTVGNRISISTRYAVLSCVSVSVELALIRKTGAQQSPAKARTLCACWFHLAG